MTTLQDEKAYRPGGLLTPQDVAAWAGVSPKHIYELARAGKLPRVPGLGRVVRFHPDAIARYFELEP